MGAFFNSIEYSKWSHRVKTRYRGLKAVVYRKLPSSLTLEETVEQAFLQHRCTESVRAVRTGLIMGFMLFVLLLSLNVSYDTSPVAAQPKILVIFGFFGMLYLLNEEPPTIQQLRWITKTAILLSIFGLIMGPVLSQTANDYFIAWAGLLLICFSAYGQLVVSGTETCWFNLAALATLGLTGTSIGIEQLLLTTTLLLLLLVNLFGVCVQYRLEDQARRLFQERYKALSAAEERTAFLRQISHNLRQPLQAVSCYALVLEAAYSNKPDEHLGMVVNKLGAAIDELNNAFIHILDIANLETGKQIPLFTNVDINVLLARLEDQFAPQAAKRGLKLIVKLRTLPPYNVQSDASILSQIIGNLIDNAIKYTVSGWVLVGTSHVGNNQLKLRVVDTGIGISEQQKPKIFDEFFRCQHRDQDPHAQGLGIGLAYVAKAITHLPEHSIRVCSKTGDGSDFQLRLPLTCDPPFCLYSAKNRDWDELAGVFVYLVDDDNEVLDALAQRLAGWGCLVQKADSKANVAAALQENIRQPDLLISDFFLERSETAHDIIACVEANCGPVPTLILSAHAITDEQKHRLPDHALLLRKPASADTLLEHIYMAMPQRVRTSQTRIVE